MLSKMKLDEIERKKIVVVSIAESNSGGGGGKKQESINLITTATAAASFDVHEIYAASCCRLCDVISLQIVSSSSLFLNLKQRASK
jgi:hypothetical protein